MPHRGVFLAEGRSYATRRHIAVDNSPVGKI